MEPNNLCRALIVYGSYAPGGENHHLVADLPGTWQQGQLLATQIGRDELAPGESDIVDAWMIKFSDCNAVMFTPEWEAQKTLLLERWKQLDLNMGEQWARTIWRWWPKSHAQKPSEFEAGKNGMVVVNIYLPVKHFSYLPSAISTHSSFGVKNLDIWLGYFETREYLQRYFNEDYSKEDGPISEFVDDQYETWIDHDFMEVTYSESANNLHALIEDTSFDDLDSHELNRRINESNIKQFNTLVILEAKQIEAPRSIYKDAMALHYLGQFTVNDE